MVKEIPISSRIVEQLSRATVKTIMDGIVELVTNSDDSYRRLEEKTSLVMGKIEIYINRKKGGICEELVVKDSAEGMTKEELENALEFAGETSGFSKGKTVRGLFGRGLKETIIALGEGEITTVKDGKVYKTKVWVDKKTKKPVYDDELLNHVEETTLENSTEVRIRVTNEKAKVPTYESFKAQFTNHYALRDINSSKNREIILRFDDINKNIMKGKIAFSYPEGDKIVENEISLPNYGDKVKVTIYESPTPLESPRNNPYGLAGILIKTKGAILDNKLFRFENENAALYFFGEALCNDLEERLRRGETELIDMNRGGLEWRHEYCQCLENEIERILEQLVLRKKKDLEKRPAIDVEEPTRKMLEKLRSLLNNMAEEELEELEELPVDPGPDIKTLVLKPEWTNVAKDKPRTLSIYAPSEMVQTEGDETNIKSDTLDIQPLVSVVKLEKHPKYPERLWYRYFKVVGRTENASGIITATLGKQKAIARVKVAPPKKKKKGKLPGQKRGFIKDITPDEEESPTQRTFYDKNTGIIKIYVNFPSVTKIIRKGLEGAQTPEGRILLAELVGEAFCRELARRKLDINPAAPGGEIDAFNNEMNKLQKRALHQIQRLIFNWNFPA
ncbi:MAG: ATP-binding protein [Candidatus Bathyarchaeia archaeon]|jgi:hypothetical protein|nr:hypothetical protein [Candidatus Bathyarchaeota archaeon A05DMB-4]MDH7595765.1 ATP-binding protein [Candidatus Bathyarchaeota archaeon]